MQATDSYAEIIVYISIKVMCMSV